MSRPHPRSTGSPAATARLAALVLALGFVALWLSSAATGATTPPYPPTAPCPIHVTCVGGAPAPPSTAVPGASAPTSGPGADRSGPGPGASQPGLGASGPGGAASSSGDATRARHGHGHDRTPGTPGSTPRRRGSGNAPTSAAPSAPRHAAQQQMLEFGGVHFPLWWIAVIAGAIIVAGTLLILAIGVRRR